jgi:hypothetical protein
MTTVRDDEQEITKLLARYCNHLDLGDHEEWVQLFTEDGEFLVYGRSFAGHDGLRRMASSAPPGLHLAGTPIVEVDGDQAVAEQSFLFVDQVTRETRIGYYDDVLRRERGRWLLRSRRSTFLTPSGPSERP